MLLQCLLPLQPLLPKIQPLLLQSLQFTLNLVSLKRDLVCLLWLWPEIGDGEPFIEVMAVVEHNPDGKHDVHAELGKKSAKI